MAEAEIEGAVDVEHAVRSLPRAHLLLLRAALIGFNDQELAVLVGVPPESVRPLLRIAAAKLGSNLAELDGSSPVSTDPPTGGQ